MINLEQKKTFPKLLVDVGHLGNPQGFVKLVILSLEPRTLVTEWSTDLNRKVVEGLVEGSNEVVEASDLVKLRGQKTKAPCMIHDLAP